MKRFKSRKFLTCSLLAFRKVILILPVLVLSASAETIWELDHQRPLTRQELTIYRSRLPEMTALATEEAQVRLAHVGTQLEFVNGHWAIPYRLSNSTFRFRAYHASLRGLSQSERQTVVQTRLDEGQNIYLFRSGYATIRLSSEESRLNALISRLRNDLTGQSLDSTDVAAVEARLARAEAERISQNDHFENNRKLVVCIRRYLMGAAVASCASQRLGDLPLRR
jgi:hypothetical protein